MSSQHGIHYMRRAILLLIHMPGWHTLQLATECAILAVFLLSVTLCHFAEFILALTQPHCAILKYDSQWMPPQEGHLGTKEMCASRDCIVVCFDSVRHKHARIIFSLTWPGGPAVWGQCSPPPSAQTPSIPHPPENTDHTECQPQPLTPHTSTTCPGQMPSHYSGSNAREVGRHHQSISYRTPLVHSS